MRGTTIALTIILLMLALCASVCEADGTVTISNYWCESEEWRIITDENGNHDTVCKKWPVTFDFRARVYSNAPSITTMVGENWATFTITNSVGLAPNSYAVLDGRPWWPIDGAKHYRYGFDLSWTNNDQVRPLRLCLEPLPAYYSSIQDHASCRTMELRFNHPTPIHVEGNMSGAPGVRFCLSNIVHPIVPEPSSILVLAAGLAGVAGATVRSRAK